MTEANDKSLEAFIEAGAAVLGLPVKAEWRPAVLANLRVTLGHAASVASFDLPDEAEPAPIFRA
jgi:hypothetical protein